MADHQNIMCEVEIQPDIQECVEIESIPVDISDTVETIVECGEPMISMQPLEGRDIILEAQEEIIDDSGDPLNIYDVPVPDASDLYVESSPGPSKKRRSPTKGRSGGGILGHRRADNEMLLSDMHVETKPRKWEQKQVQIKTMEGEFSVTMWASGASDGKSPCPIDERHFSRPEVRAETSRALGTCMGALWDARGGRERDFGGRRARMHDAEAVGRPSLHFLPYFVMADDCYYGGRVWRKMGRLERVEREWREI